MSDKVVAISLWLFIDPVLHQKLADIQISFNASDIERSPAVLVNLHEVFVVFQVGLGLRLVTRRYDGKSHHMYVKYLLDIRAVFHQKLANVQKPFSTRDIERSPAALVSLDEVFVALQVGLD